MSKKQWKRALITGASSGIGEAFARRLAIVSDAVTLVARRRDRLDTLATELSAHCEVAVLAVDLLRTEDVAAVIEHLRQCGPVDLLVNNAGFSTLGPFSASAIDAELNMVRLHEEATLALTRAALPAMSLENRGAVINVSSIAAFLGVPGVATYAGSKAFLVNFSRALDEELAGTAISVQCLCPGYTRTEIHTRESFAGFDVSRVPEDLWMEAEAVVSESLAALDNRVGREMGAAPWLLVPGAHNRARVRDSLRGLADAIPE